MEGLSVVSKQRVNAALAGYDRQWKSACARFNTLHHRLRQGRKKTFFGIFEVPMWAYYMKRCRSYGNPKGLMAYLAEEFPEFLTEEEACILVRWLDVEGILRTLVDNSEGDVVFLGDALCRFIVEFTGEKGA